jgi:hypothetical protein
MPAGRQERLLRDLAKYRKHPKTVETSNPPITGSHALINNTPKRIER